jgi:hypothetical protein
LADQRITQLTQLNEADVAATDVLPIVDISASETKKVRAKDLFEAGATLADNSSIDLSKLNQSSATKLGTTALADDAITAAKLANDSSINYGPTAPSTDNFEGRGHVSSTTKYLSVWDGSVFQQVIAPTAGIEDLAVTTGKIAANAVTTAKIDAAGLGTAAIADSAVTAAKIADGTITSSKFQAGAVDAAAIADNAVGAAELADNAVDTAAIAALAVTDAKLAAGAVTETKLGAGAVTNDKIANTTIAYGKLNLADGSIPASKIATDSIAVTQMAAGSVGTDELIDDSVTTAKIADAAVTATQLASGSVTADAIADNAVGAAELADDAVDTASIVALAVTEGKLASESVTETKLGDGAVTAVKIADTQITYAKLNLADGSVPGAKLTDASITSTQIAVDAVATGQIINNAVTTAKIADDAVTVDKLAAGAVDATALADSAVTTAKVADGGVTYAKIQNVTDTDKLLGRSSAGAGAVEEIACTSAGRALLDDADAAAQRTTLGLGTLATQDGTFSGTFSGTSSGTNTGDQTITLTGDVTGSGTGSFAASIATDAVTTAKIATGAVTTDELGTASVTGAKLAADSSTVVSGNAPSGSGEFEGQQWFNTNTGFTYVWDGTAWQQQAGVQSFAFTDGTPLTFSASVSAAGVATITTGLENQNANTVFAGPTTGSATTPGFRALVAADLPVAAAGTNGAIQPGTGLTVAAGGVLNHTNIVSPGVYTKVTVDAQGHISTGANLTAADVPSLDASKITTGTFTGEFLAANSVTAAQLADYGIAQVSESAPTPEFAGQWWVNPSDRSAYIWIGTVSPTPNGYWLLVGYGSPTQLNLRFGGTYNASTNLVVSLNQYGTEAGLTIGQSLTAPNPQNNGVYLIATTAGTGTTPAPTVSLAAGDWVLSQGTGANWTKIAVVSGATGTFNDYDILSDGTYFTPDMTGVTDVRDALVLLWGRAQIATTSQIGTVLESTEVLVDNSTGAMSIGVVDDGTY